MANLGLTWNFASLLGQPEDFSKVQDDFADVETWANGANIGTNQLENAIVTTAKLAVLPAVRVFHSVDVALIHNTIQVLAFNSERFDTDGIHDTVTNNSRLTCQTAGIYNIFGGVQFEVGTYDQAQVAIRLNGTAIIAANERESDSGAGGAFVATSTIYELSVNDFVELRVFQTNAVDGNRNIEATGNFSPEFGMSFRCPAA